MVFYFEVFFNLGFHRDGEGCFFCCFSCFKVSNKSLKQKLSILCVDYTEQCPSFRGVVRLWLVVEWVIVWGIYIIFGGGEGFIGCIGIWVIRWFTFFFFWLHGVARGILVPQPGIEPVSPAVEAESPNHWTTREVPGFLTCERKREKPSERLTLSRSSSGKAELSLNPGNF